MEAIMELEVEVDSQATESQEIEPIEPPEIDSKCSELEDEYADNGRIGGYLRINIGDILNDGQYIVIKKKGWGTFSTTWIVQDTITKKTYIMKVVKSAEHYYNAALTETELLKKVQGMPNIVQYVSDFEIEDKFAPLTYDDDREDKLFHKCIVMEDHGDNLLKLFKHYPGRKILFSVIKQVGCQLLAALVSLKKKKIIHSDIKLENVVFKFVKKCDNPVDDIIEITLIDIGSGFIKDNVSRGILSTRQYRAFEIILEFPTVDEKIDVWSVACLIFELAAGECQYLFEPHTGKNYTRDEDHLALIFELVCKIPTYEFVSRGYKFRELFNQDKKKGAIELKNIKSLKYWKLYDVLFEKYKWTPKLSTMFSNLLLPMLVLNPNKRISAKNALKMWSK